MQGVFLEKLVVGLQELENLVNSYPRMTFIKISEGIFLPQEKYVYIMTEKQKEEFMEQLSMLTMIGLFPSISEILTLKDILPGVGTQESDTSTSWSIKSFLCFIRPRTKKELKQQIMKDPSIVHLEATSIFGNEFEGKLSLAPLTTYSVVGPDPKYKRSWYGTISWSEKSNSWAIK